MNIWTAKIIKQLLCHPQLPPDLHSLDRQSTYIKNAAVFLVQNLVLQQHCPK